MAGYAESNELQAPGSGLSQCQDRTSERYRLQQRKKTSRAWLKWYVQEVQLWVFRLVSNSWHIVTDCGSSGQTES